MRAVVVANPRAGRGTGRAMDLVTRRLRAGGTEVTTRLTRGQGDAENIVRDAIADGASLVVAVGGDGTAHECANGFFRDGSLTRADVELAVVPVGTGSDFHRSLNAPSGLADTVDRVVTGQARLIDVGCVRRPGPPGVPARVFLNAAGAGLGAEVAARVERAPALKRLLGSRVFGAAAAAAIASHASYRVRLTIDDGPPETLSISTVAVCNGRCFGGGMQAAPDALLDDGLFSTVVLLSSTRLRLLAALGAVYRGRHRDLSIVRIAPARRVVLEPAGSLPVPLEVDGEGHGVLPVVVDIIPSALAIRA